MNRDKLRKGLLTYVIPSLFTALAVSVWLKSGESKLETIAQQEPVRQEAQANLEDQLDNPNCYVVQPNDNTYHIATRIFKVDFDEFVEFNDMENPNLIYPGDELCFSSPVADPNAEIPEANLRNSVGVPQQPPYGSGDTSSSSYSGNLTVDQVREVAQSVFPVSVAEYFVKISTECEVQDGDPNAVGADGEVGLWQILPVHRSSFPDEMWENRFDPYINALMALHISTERMPEGAYDLTRWTCQGKLSLPEIVYE